MSVLDTLQADMKTAMKAGDAPRLSAIRMLISAVRYVSIDKPGMTDEDVLDVLRREAKKRRESVAAYTTGNRPELAEQEQKELELIESYLPAQMDEGAVRAKVQEVLGAAHYDNFGMAMNAVMKELKGKAEGGVVSRIVREMYK